MLHTSDDLDYLARTVVGPTSSDPHLTWLASSRLPSGVCQWADNTTVENFHIWTTTCSSTT